MTWLEDYEGLSLEAVRILARDQGRPVRELHPEDVITMEWQPDRLNLWLDAEGRLLRVTEG